MTKVATLQDRPTGSAKRKTLKIAFVLLALEAIYLVLWLGFGYDYKDIVFSIEQKVNDIVHRKDYEDGQFCGKFHGLLALKGSEPIVDHYHLPGVSLTVWRDLPYDPKKSFLKWTSGFINGYEEIVRPPNQPASIQAPIAPKAPTLESVLISSFEALDTGNLEVNIRGRLPVHEMDGSIVNHVISGRIRYSGRSRATNGFHISFMLWNLDSRNDNAPGVFRDRNLGPGMFLLKYECRGPRGRVVLGTSNFTTVSQNGRVIPPGGEAEIKAIVSDDLLAGLKSRTFTAQNDSYTINSGDELWAVIDVAGYHFASHRLMKF